MCCCIATGVPWQDKEIDSVGSVLYLAGEGSRGISKRVKAWEIQRGTEAKDLLVMDQFADLMDESTCTNLLCSIKDYNRENPTKEIKLIVVDTLARFFLGEENSSKDMGMLIANLTHIAKTLDINVMTVHHTGKDETKGPRGSSVLKSACDYAITVSADKDNLLAELKCSKAKDSEEFKPITLQLDLVKLGKSKSGDNVASLCVRDNGVTNIKPKSQSQAAKNIIKAGLLMNVDMEATREMLKESVEQELVKAGFEINANTFSKALNYLSNKGKIAVTKMDKPKNDIIKYIV